MPPGLPWTVFDPYLSSRPLAEAILKAPEGTLIIDHHYYTFSSIFFYTGCTALLLNGRFIISNMGPTLPAHQMCLSTICNSRIVA